MLRFAAVCLLVIVAGCGTYYDPVDEYVRGVRTYDRGDFVGAKEIWEPLARAGDCDAQFRIGLLAAIGRALPHDPALVLRWWDAAANQGQPQAELALGDFYNPDNSYTRLFCKKGCPKDAATAYKWYLLGERFAGYDTDKQYAAFVLAKIRAQLTPEQLHSGESAAASWKPTPRQCRPRVLL